MTNVRQFIRGGYLTAVEPTEVLRGTEVIGEWHPRVGYSVSPPKAQEPPVVVPALAATPEPSRTGDGSGVAPDPTASMPVDRSEAIARRGSVATPAFRPFSKADQAKGKRA